MGVDELSRRIRALERSGRAGATETGQKAIETGWSLGSGPTAEHITAAATLARGGVHEWYVEEEAGATGTPPLCLLAHLAGRALDAGPGSALWVGKRCWPHPRSLIRAGGADPSPLRRSVFVDPPDDGTRFWSIDVALRNPATAVVVADGAGLDMATSRRLQLAAEAGGRAIALLARPTSDRGMISAATTRWSVRRMPTELTQPRWRLTLERWKGGALDLGRERSCELVWDDEMGALLPAPAPAGASR